MENLSTQKRGAGYRVRALQFLAVLGYASVRQLARCIWGRCDASSRRMASRTLRALLVRRLVVSKRAGEGVNRVNYELLFALTSAGAEEARRHGVGLVACKVHARDYLRHAHEHRTACNSVYAALPGGARWSELQIRAGSSPVPKFEYGMTEEGRTEFFCKIPDLIITQPDGYEWVEVENSWRSAKELDKVVDFMRALFHEPSAITRIHFVITVAGARSIGGRLKARFTHTPISGMARKVRELDARILAAHLKVSELDLETLELRAVPL